ncbi:MAG: hypothetical protein IMW95_09065 [Moorella humiferrea]|nr:hypothetical protein [Moorella humiferrea]
MPISSLSIKLDRKEYSRYGAASQANIIRARVTPLPTTGLTGEILRCRIYKINPRGNRELLIAEQQATLDAADYSRGYIFSFDLNSIRDSHGIPMVTQGFYRVEADSPTSLSALPVEQVVPVSIITVKELRSQWLFGAPLRAHEVLLPQNQPSNVAGVSIEYVEQNHDIGTFLLKWDPVARSLSWAEGPGVIVPDDESELILKDRRNQSYIKATVIPFDLPANPAQDEILIDHAEMTDDVLRDWLWKAKPWLETQINIFLEPTIIVTDIQDEEYYDERRETVAYYRPRNRLQWVSIQLPYRPLLFLERLEGWFQDSRVVNIPSEWHTWTEKTGQISLVPRRGAAINWQFYGAAVFQLFYTYDYVPDFWHFKGIFGLRDLYGEREIIREAIARKATMSILDVAGSAYRAGYSSESIGRDNISEAVTYTSSATFGIYSAHIAEHQKWFYGERVGEGNLRRLKQKFGGIPVVVL